MEVTSAAHSSTSQRPTGSFDLRILHPEVVALPLDTEVTGRKTLPFEVGVHRFEVTTDALINVAVGSRVFGSNGVRVFDGRNEQLASVNAAGAPAYSGVLRLPVGSYAVEARAGFDDRTGEYRVAALRIEHPTEIEINGSGSGSFSLMGERRYYRFTGAAGQRITLRAEPAALLGVELRLRRPGEQPFYARPQLAATSYLPGFPVAIENFVLPESGVYVIELVPHPDSSTGTLTKGSYQLRVQSP